MKVILCQLFCGFLFLYFQVCAQNTGRNDNKISKQPPVIPVGMDAYRMWYQLPLQRIG